MFKESYYYEAIFSASNKKKNKSVNENQIVQT